MLRKLPEMSSLFLMLFIFLLLKPCLRPFLLMGYFWRLQVFFFLFPSFLPLDTSLLCAYHVSAPGMLNKSKSRKNILDHLLIIPKKEKLRCSEVLWGPTWSIKRFMIFITLESMCVHCCLLNFFPPIVECLIFWELFIQWNTIKHRGEKIFPSSLLGSLTGLIIKLM